MQRTGKFAMVLTLAGLFGLAAIVPAQTEAPVVASVTVSPDTAEVVVGDEIQFSAETLDANGEAVEAAVVWSVNDEELGAISAEGLLAAKKEGVVLVIATVGALADTAVVTVAKAEEPPVEEPVPAAVAVSPDSSQVTEGETVEFSAAVTDAEDNTLEATVVWTVQDSTVGSITAEGVFSALKAGETMVIATLGALSDTAMVWVVAAEEPPAVALEISPEEGTVAIDEAIQFTAEGTDVDGESAEVTVTWALSDSTIGAIDESGLFTGKAEGETFVIATAGALVDSARVTVTGEPVIEPGTPTATLYRNKDGKITRIGSAAAEGDTLVIGGMPHPFNFLNGTKLMFPEGSLTESVSITVSIPKFAKVELDSVIFNGQLLTGVTFEVAVNDTVVSPYYFGAPIVLSMPYKRGLMRNLGLEPEDLAMYFANELGEIEIDNGITDIEVDEDNDLITGSVAHFSTIVVAPESAKPAAVEENTPAVFALSQNVPNPFNPSTSITFAVPSAGMVTLSIHNVLGQEVRTLVNGRMVSGSHSVVWNGLDDSGRRVTSGVYFYRLQAGPLSATKKLMLLK